MACKKVRGQIIDRVRQGIKEGKKIAILDHGGPLIYGPWVWVLEEFADLTPTVIPGVSSFNAASAILKKEVTSG
ncbi:tetrapyrrole methylase, partial [bacterium]|nr:tetrapyrrole methylase [bacterium]